MGIVLRQQGKPVAWISLLFAWWWFGFATSVGAQEVPAAQNRAEEVRQDSSSGLFGRLPMQFEVNRGQTDGQVRYLARGRGYTLFLAPTESVLSLRKFD